MIDIDKERQAFERWVTAPPFDRSTARYGYGYEQAWPGQYLDIAVSLAWEAWQAHAEMVDAAPQPPTVRQSLIVQSAATPALYQHDDGRYALALGDVARHKLTDSDPAWHRVPLDVVVTTTETEE